MRLVGIHLAPDGRIVAGLLDAARLLVLRFLGEVAFLHIKHVLRDDVGERLRWLHSRADRCIRSG